jgi:3,4-dihydroxy 2-butanone 4-phosphate synthase / GTP cyclohydrolase II
MENKNLLPTPISPIEEIVADMAAGRIVILVDEEDRENEGDLVLAADFVTPEAINFMAKFRAMAANTARRSLYRLKRQPALPPVFRLQTAQKPFKPLLRRMRLPPI